MVTLCEYKTDGALRKWVRQAADLILSLPAKEAVASSVYNLGKGV